MIDQLAALRDKIDELQEENRQLKAARAPVVVMYEGLDATASELFLLAVLTRGGVCSQNYLIDRIAMLHPGEYSVISKTIDVHVCRLRKKLKVLAPPIEINNKWGVGYWMDAANKALLAERVVR